MGIAEVFLVENAEESHRQLEAGTAIKIGSKLVESYWSEVSKNSTCPPAPSTS